MEINKLKANLEALLFACGEPVELDRLAKVMEIDKATLIKVANSLAADLNDENRGIILTEIDGRYELSTKEQYQSSIRELLMIKRDAPLSQAAFEVLAIIAYNQPVTRGFVSGVRGVDSDGSVVNLVEKGLVEEAGRLELPGRPIAYKTTDQFLRCFNISHLSQLPPLPKASDDESPFMQLEMSDDEIKEE